MNQIKAFISDIKTIDNLNIVEFDYFDTKLKMMSLELHEEINIGKKVLLNIKPTHISVSKDSNLKLTISNQIQGKVQDIAIGKLLVSLQAKVFDTTLESIFTFESLNQLNIKKNDEVTLLIKASDLFVAEVLDD